MAQLRVKATFIALMCMLNNYLYARVKYGGQLKAVDQICIILHFGLRSVSNQESNPPEK